jgi:hypothetical protein
MRVRILTQLKNGPDIIDRNTIFEGPEESLPDFVLYELKRNRGTIEILPDLKKKRGRKPKPIPAEPAKPKDKSGFVSNEPKKKSTSLREKLTKTEK